MTQKELKELSGRLWRANEIMLKIERIEDKLAQITDDKIFYDIICSQITEKLPDKILGLPELLADFRDKLIKNLKGQIIYLHKQFDKL